MPRLFTHNVQVDKWNDFQLSELAGDETVLAVSRVVVGPLSDAEAASVREYGDLAKFEDAIRAVAEAA